MDAFSSCLQRQQQQQQHHSVITQLQACSRFKQQQQRLSLPPPQLLLCSTRGKAMSSRRRSTIAAGGGGGGGALATVCSSETVRWVSSISAAALLFVKRVAIFKPLLVPLLALSLPRDMISWMRGEYGQWTAFLALGTRLFYFIPGELDLPLMLLLVVLIAPVQVMQQRSAQAGLLIWATLASYVGFQHFSRVGGFGRSLEQRHLIPSVASACLIASPLVLLYRGY